MPSTNSRQHEQPPEDFDDVLLFEEILRERCYHEAGHAVFACHDGTEIDKVRVSDKKGVCTINRADLYEQYSPWRYAQFCLAGAYAGHLGVTLEHPKVEDVPISELREDAVRVPEGDAWWVVDILDDFAATEDFPFADVEEAYAVLFDDVGEQMERLWEAIEAVAVALLNSYWESGEEKLGCLAGGDVISIVESTREEVTDA